MADSQLHPQEFQWDTVPFGGEKNKIKFIFVGVYWGTKNKKKVESKK